MNTTVGELIEKLREESEEGVGFHSTAWAEAFVALDEEPRFAGGVLGSRRPAASPVIRELVRRGVAALHELLDHLDDARPTGLSVGHNGFFGAMWHADEYAPRHADPKKHPTGVNTGRETNEGFERTEPHGQNYTLRVGDLCFVAVGQIVNRPLCAVRYQPTACLVVNSPVRTPKLADAVRADWAGLDTEGHKRSLTQDSFFTWPAGAPAALKRLCFYYPDEGKPLALRFLARPLIDGRTGAWDFVTTRLLGEQDPSRWIALIEEFRKESGPVAETIPDSLRHIASGRAGEEQRTEQAAQVLAAVYPGYEFSPSFVNATSSGDQADLIQALASFDSTEIDAAVADVFRRAASLVLSDYWGRVPLDDLARACLARLLGKGHDEMFRGWLTERIRAIEATPDSSPERYRLDSLRQWLARLTGDR